MTIFMLVMCVVIMTTMSMIRMKLDSDLVNARSINSAISTGGELNENGEIVMYGYELISGIIGTVDIDARIPDDKDKVYTFLAGGTSLNRKYNFNFNGTSMSDLNSLISGIDPTKSYTVRYNMSNATVKGTIYIEERS